MHDTTGAAAPSRIEITRPSAPRVSPGHRCRIPSACVEPGGTLSRVVALVVVGAVLGAPHSALAQMPAGAVAMTPPSCEAYQRERPRGGPFEQLSDLFGLSIYHWGAVDYARYRALMLDCKRSTPDFRADTTMRDWETLTEKSVAGLQSYTGYVNQLGEPMGRQNGSRPRPGEPDYTRAFESLSCDRFTRGSINAWARGGPPDATSTAPFSVPLAAWRYEVWRAFENRVLACVQLPASEAQTERDWLHTLVYGQEVDNAVAIRQAQQDAAAGSARLDGILARAAEAEGLRSADEIAGKLTAVDALAAEAPRLPPAEEQQVAAARERIVARLRAARTAEAAAWERERPAREARARQQDEELTELRRQNLEREKEAAGERERAARIEAERQAGIRAQAERQAADAEAQRQREDAQRAADQQVREKAEAESAARAQREAEAALARDPCNQPEMRRRLMQAANGMDRARYGGRRLIDLMRGRSMRVQGEPGVSCMFLGQWSSGEQGLVTITVRKNSLGDDLIEVRP